jgi:hypothetical protein
MSARNGPGDDDRRLPEGERQIGERLAGLTQDTPTVRQNHPRRADRPHAWGHGYVVTARSGRRSLCLLVVRCLFGCGCVHRFTAPSDFDRGLRSAPCGGRFMLHVVTAEGRVAA